MKSIIIWEGRYGATKQYAEWLGADLQMPVARARDIGSNLDDPDLLLLGSSVYIGNLQIRNWLKRNTNTLSGKKILFFLVCGTDLEEVAKLESYLRAGVPDKLQGQMTVFFLPGRVEIKKLGWLDRLALWMGANVEKDRSKKKEMLSGYDRINRELLAPIIDQAKRLITGKPKLEGIKNLQ